MTTQSLGLPFSSTHWASISWKMAENIAKMANWRKRLIFDKKRQNLETCKTSAAPYFWIQTKMKFIFFVYISTVFYESVSQAWSWSNSNAENCQFSGILISYNLYLLQLFWVTIRFEVIFKMQKFKCTQHATWQSKNASKISTRFSANKLVRKIDICASNQNFRPKTTNFSNFKFIKSSNQLKFKKHQLSTYIQFLPKVIVTLWIFSLRPP